MLQIFSAKRCGVLSRSITLGLELFHNLLLNLAYEFLLVSVLLQFGHNLQSNFLLLVLLPLNAMTWFSYVRAHPE